MNTRGMQHWLPGYLGSMFTRGAARRRRTVPGQGPTHLIFVVCDHFEPRHGASDPLRARQRIEDWRAGYQALQRRCRDAFGTTPLHTFFYPPHHGAEHLPALARLVYEGCGEVELHYHHDGDTADTLRRNLGAAIVEYQRHGLLLQQGDPPGRGFGFVHGDWALDNSRGGTLCGVNGELTVLRELGCWGDFTMPSADMCQTRKINSIYYAVDDPARAKSHDTGEDARVGRVDPPGLFLMQGPLALNFAAPGHPRVESASLTSENWGRPDRIRAWIDCNVHVKGRPDWLFVKLHTHGAIERDYDALFGERAFDMHRVLNESYNDGRRHVLHYATARQAYNVVKAAEAGLGGSPAQWFDHRVGRPVAREYLADFRHRLLRCTPQRLSLVEAAPVGEALLRTHIGPLAGLRAATLSALDIDVERGEVVVEGLAPGGTLDLEIASGSRLRAARGAQATGSQNPAGLSRLNVTGTGTVQLAFESASPARTERSNRTH